MLKNMIFNIQKVWFCKVVKEIHKVKRKEFLFQGKPNFGQGKKIYWQYNIDKSNS